MVGHLLDESARGVFIGVVTPFADNGALDLQSLDRLLDFHLDARVHGIAILGTMGEVQKLTYEETRLVMRRALGRIGDEVPVVVGVATSSGLATLAALASDAMAAGAGAVMVAPPAGLATDEQIEGYVHQLASAIGEDVPLVLQDCPQASGVHLSVGLLNRLVDELRQIVALAHEDCPGLGKITRIRTTAERDGRRRIAILVGNGGLFYPLELERGADGALAGFAYPELLVEVFERFGTDRVEDAYDIYDAYLPLIRYEQQPGIGLAIRKEILHRRGLLASPALRPPGPRLDASDRQELDALLTRLERRVAAGL